jgi:hypothetical protein
MKTKKVLKIVAGYLLLILVGLIAAAGWGVFLSIPSIVSMEGYDSAVSNFYTPLMLVLAGGAGTLGILGVIRLANWLENLTRGT